MDMLQFVPATICTVKATLAAGTTTTYSTTGATLYCIRGKAYSVAAATNAATPTTDATTGLAFPAIAIGFAAAFVWGYDASGNVKVSQGSQVALNADGSFAQAPAFPMVPDTVCPFAYELVRLNPATATTPAVATWTMGASNQSGVTGVTYTRQDVMTMPDRPQIV
jgi:hypothetical protein